MYEYLAQHTESVTFTRASSLVPTAKPEIINLRKAALAVDHDRTQLKNVRNGRSDGKVSDVLSTRAYRSHILGVQAAKDEQEQYFCPALTGNVISFASHAYRVVYLTYKGVYKNKNWQWVSNEQKYGGEVEAK
eukprot:4018269-Amphidinium_carterae.1